MHTSLIIRTRNEENNIADCLTRIIHQTLLPTEILLVDNNSTDKTVEIVKKFTDKLPIKIINNPVIGYSSGLNLGCELAKYEIIGFLSADCLPDSTWLEKLHNTMIEYNCDVVFGHEKLVGENDADYVINKMQKISIEDQSIIFFSNTNVIYRTDTLRNFLPFRGLGKDAGGEDTLMSIKLYESGKKAIKCNSAIVEHRVYESMEDFKRRAHEQGSRLFSLFITHPFYPRIYLSPFYWALLEISCSFKYRDFRFARVGTTRLIHVLKGLLKA